MIDIVCRRGEGVLTITGHAASGPPGADLICGAVSTLAHTLEVNLTDLAAADALAEMSVELVPGRGRFVFVPRPEAADTVEQRVEAICLGFAMLARRAGEFVRYEEK